MKINSYRKTKRLKMWRWCDLSKIVGSTTNNEIMQNSNTNVRKHGLDLFHAGSSGDGPSGTLDQCPVAGDVAAPPVI